MKKTLLISCMLLSAPIVLAQENFTPIPICTNVPAQNLQTDESIGNGNIQNAISQIENAQVDIRNQLLDLKTKFADVDAQYVSYKNERKTLKKQVSITEKRLKSLDKTKDKMRKNML